MELALKLCDLQAILAEKDSNENKQDYEWEMHFWLDTYRLLDAELGIERRARWRKEIEKIVSWFVRETAGRIDFPRYQGPYIRTSTNHLALFASTVYLAGRVFGNKEWQSNRSDFRGAANAQNSRRSTVTTKSQAADQEKFVTLSTKLSRICVKVSYVDCNERLTFASIMGRSDEATVARIPGAIS